MLWVKRSYNFAFTIWGKLIKNRLNFKNNNFKKNRYLEIGPGQKRIQNFETLDIVGSNRVDYVWDAGRKLPFNDNTFDIIYASHILEHIPWYKTESVLFDWTRVLKHNGQLEVCVPDGLKIIEVITKAELENINLTFKDNWYKFNSHKDPYLWASGRIFTYGDGSGNPNHPNWHKAIFTPKYLKKLFRNIGLIDIIELKPTEIRGYDHGWINFGLKGKKP